MCFRSVIDAEGVSTSQGPTSNLLNSRMVGNAINPAAVRTSAYSHEKIYLSARPIMKMTDADMRNNHPIDGSFAKKNPITTKGSSRTAMAVAAQCNTRPKRQAPDGIAEIYAGQKTL